MAKFDFAAAGIVGGGLGVTAETKVGEANSAVMAVIADILSIIKKAGGYKDDKGNETAGYTAYRATFLKTLSEGLGITMDEAKNKASVKRYFADARLAYDSNFSTSKVAGFSSSDAMRADPKTKKRDKGSVGGRPPKPAFEKATDYLTKVLPDLEGGDRRKLLIWLANECRIKMTIEAPAIAAAE